jgi:mono/diheme cytochrome c family protein
MKNLSLFVLLCIAVIGLACTENTENLVAAPDDGDNNEPISQVSYADQIQPIFNNNCAGCHGSSGGVGLSSYLALMSSIGNNYGENVVVPGNANASGLVDKIEPNPEHGSRMPTNGSLTPAEIQLIRTWINEGALNN